MKRYLDPKHDLIFKRIFGEHPEILKTFLNAVLPLKQKIVSLEYLPPEQVPAIPILKQTIVDVRCKDKDGRQFIVEMQMSWTNAFLQRVLFNTSKAYVNQLGKNEHFKLLQPVMGLSLLNDVFIRDDPAFYHHYKIVNVKKSDQVIEGLELVFVELPKFVPPSSEETGGQETDFTAWLRYLTETGEEDSAPEELAERGPELKEALELAETAAYNRNELAAYDHYWDVIRTERTLMEGRFDEGMEKGLETGREQGMEKGVEKGIEKGLEIALKKLMARGFSEAEAKETLGLA